FCAKAKPQEHRINESVSKGRVIIFNINLPWWSAGERWPATALWMRPGRSKLNDQAEFPQLFPLRRLSLRQFHKFLRPPLADALGGGFFDAGRSIVPFVSGAFGA